MCGLIGFFGRDSYYSVDFSRSLQLLYRRGPDGGDSWSAPGVHLAHRRLAILDLDFRASQPMHSACGRYVIVFNGEIYNFRDLRISLQSHGHRLSTTSDTEVILNLFSIHGPAMLRMLNGMFAFVIWDKMAKRAFAARDPYGIKPLYLASTDRGILFCSQVKALLATGIVARDPDPIGRAAYWMLGSVPEPHTWYKAIRTVPAGHYIWVDQGRITNTRCWHDIGESWRHPTDLHIPEAEIPVRIRAALRESVERHLIADVPVGVFLSGGIDSGALAGLIVEAGARDLQGVTIAYEEYAGQLEDEAPVAAKTANYYGIHHHIRKVTQEEFLSDLPLILEAMDQPSIDGVNTWYASKAAAELGLKVAISGVGGDELFLGYTSFRHLPNLVSMWSHLSRLPGSMFLANLVASWQARRTVNSRWSYAPQWARTIEGAWWLRRSINSPALLNSLMDPELVTEAMEGFSVERSVNLMTGALPTDQMMALAQIESMSYLRNQLLRDCDWAGMYHSVEIRTPLVDTLLLQHVQPYLRSFSRFPGKRLLASAPLHPLPPQITHRLKTGFAIPIERWLSMAGFPAIGAPSSNWVKYVAQSYAQS